MSNSFPAVESTVSHYGDFPLNCKDGSGLYDLSGVWEGDQQLTNFAVLQAYLKETVEHVYSLVQLIVLKQKYTIVT